MPFLGTLEGLRTFVFTPDVINGTWVLGVSCDPECLAGCKVIHCEDLQSSHSAAIITGGDFFVFKEFGYKNRSSWINAYKGGKKIELPATILAAMGLIPCKREVVKVEVPAIESPLAEALKKAGLA
jgi:hypothetical protein